MTNDTEQQPLVGSSRYLYSLIRNEYNIYLPSLQLKYCFRFRDVVLDVNRFVRLNVDLCEFLTV